MIITDISGELDPPYPYRIRSEADEMGQVRSGGLHLTPIIHALEQAVRPREEWCTQEDLAFFGAAGFLWERVFSKVHAESIMDGDMQRPGEFTLDGITGSPDLIRVTDWVLIETKHSWKSVNKFDYQFDRWFWAWIVQIACYLKMVGSNTAELHAYFVCGDWRPPVPQTRSVRMEFADVELDNYWGMIRQHAEEQGWL